MACFPDDHDFILGFAFGVPDVPLIDYVHVRGSFCRMGLGTLLASALGVTRDRPAVVAFDTPDLSREEPEAINGHVHLPIGILRSGRWPHLAPRFGH